MRRNLPLKVSLILVMISLISLEKANGQSFFNIEASQLVANFKFFDSDGVQDKTYSPIYTGAYNLGYSYEFEFGLLLSASVGMRNSGSTMVYDATNYRWDFQYLHNDLGVGYGFALGRFKPYLMVSGYSGFLLKANQRVNNEDFDIIDSESIKREDIGMFFSPGVKITLSDAISVYTEFNYLLGIRNIEIGENVQKSQNFAYSLTLGLSFAIQKM